MVPSRGSGRFSLERGKPKLFDRLREALRVRRAAGKAGSTERATCRAFRHSFATHPLESGRDIRTVRELSGREDAKTAMIHIHVLDLGRSAVRSPVDGLRGGLGGSA
jgi:site-specific recombinase XerD